MPLYYVALDLKDGSDIVRCGGTNDAHWDNLLRCNVYTNGADAAAYRKTLAGIHPNSAYTVKCFNEGDDPAWREREMARINDGFYSSVPWWDEAWRKQGDACLFEHLSSKSEGSVSYTEDDAKGRADKQAQAMTPGRFLTKFYGDVLSEQEIAEWAAKVANAKGVHITQDADLIEEIYVEGPSSCMAHDTSEFSGPCHPARVYAGPDLALAYIGDSRTGYKARCVVWPEEKFYWSIYSCSIAAREEMLTFFDEGGWTKNTMDGARVQKIDAGAGGYVMPYVDGISGAEVDGDYIVLGSGYLETQSTAGVTEDLRVFCEDCEEYFDEDDTRGVSGRDGYRRTVCDSCCGEHYTYCDFSYNYYPDEEVVQVWQTNSWNGNTYSQHCRESALTERGFILITHGDYADQYWYEAHVDTCPDCGTTYHTNDEALAELHAKDPTGVIDMFRDEPICETCREALLAEEHEGYVVCDPAPEPEPQTVTSVAASEPTLGTLKLAEYVKMLDAFHAGKASLPSFHDSVLIPLEHRPLTATEHAELMQQRHPSLWSAYQPWMITPARILTNPGA